MLREHAVLLLSEDGQQLEVAPPSETWLRITVLGSTFQLQGRWRAWHSPANRARLATALR